MSYRVSFTSLSQTAVSSLSSNIHSLVELEEQMATGVKVDEASDDATAAVQIMQANSDLQELDNWLSNIDYAQSETDVTESALSELTNAVQKLYDLSVKASNSTNGADELSAIAAEVEQLIATVVDIANTQFNGTYIFSGTNTQTETITMTDDGQYIYNGTESDGDYKRYIEISEDTTVSINLNGEDIFGYSYTDTSGTVQEDGLLSDLVNFYNELTANDIDHKAISSYISVLSSDADMITTKRALNGSLMNRFEMTTETLKDNKTTITGFKSNAEDIDMTKAISDLSYLEVALRASMKASSSLLGTSLLDYM